MFLIFCLIVLLPSGSLFYIWNTRNLLFLLFLSHLLLVFIGLAANMLKFESHNKIYEDVSCKWSFQKCLLLEDFVPLLGLIGDIFQLSPFGFKFPFQSIKWKNIFTYMLAVLIRFRVSKGDFTLDLFAAFLWQICMAFEIIHDTHWRRLSITFGYQW